MKINTKHKLFPVTQHTNLCDRYFSAIQQQLLLWYRYWIQLRTLSPAPLYKWDTASAMIVQSTNDAAFCRAPTATLVHQLLQFISQRL
jgi:hypothetical protein